MPINFPSPATEGLVHPDTAGKSWLFTNGSWGGSVEVPELVDSTPVGLISPFGGMVAPTGWLLCDGAAVDRVAYAPLFAAIADTYGPGDGSTTFNLPDMSSKVMGGADLTNVAGSNKGSETHTLTEAELPAHTHTLTLDAVANHSHSGSSFSGPVSGSVSGSTTNKNISHSHNHFYVLSQNGGGNNGYVFYTQDSDATVATDPVHSHGLDADVSGTASGNVTVGNGGGHTPTGIAAAAGAGGAHNIVQPTLYSTYIIKA